MDDDKLFNCSKYVANHIFGVLSEMFQETKQIQVILSDIMDHAPYIVFLALRKVVSFPLIAILGLTICEIY